MAGPVQWRLYMAVFVALTSLLPTLLVLAAASNKQTKHNAALNQNVIVYPSDATCGRNTEILKYPDSSQVRCGSGCMRNVSTLRKTDHRFPVDVIQMGEDKCHIAGIDRSEERSSMCWLTPISHSSFTYSVWIKPSETQTKQCVVSSRDFQLFLHDSHLEGVTYTSQKYKPDVTKLTKIKIGLWTHIAIRVQRGSESIPFNVAVFANGVFLSPALSVGISEQGPSFTGSTGDTGATGATGASQKYYGFRVGLGHSQIESNGCEILTIDACATVGHSPGVHMPNKLRHWSQSYAYQHAKRAMLLGVDNSKLKNCTWNRDLVARFACTYYFPPCSGSGTGLPPCRSLCTAAMENWCEAVGPRLVKTCEDFPDSADPTVCVGLDYKPDFGLYKGKLRHGLYYDRLLTDREIEAQYTGHLRRVRPLPECLCDAFNTPALLANSSITCAADVPGQSTSRRLNDDSGTNYDVEFVNDGDLSTAWASGAKAPEQVEIQMNFRLPIEIWEIEIRLDSYFPRKAIQIMTNRSGEFLPTQRMALDCKREWNETNDGPLTSPNSVNCQDINRLAEHSESPPYTIKLDLRKGRPTEFKPVEQRRSRRAFSRLTPLEEFLTATGIRVIFIGQPLKGNYHIVPEISVYTRNQCGCYPEGTADGYRCTDGVCQCRHLAGADTTEAGPKCRPYLTRMIPSFGPRSGGTKVVFLGGFLGRDNSSVSVRTWIESIPFQVEYSNETHIYTLTPPLTNVTGTADITDVPTKLNVILESRYELKTNTEFLYKEDPVIERIEPKRSFLRGGIVQTIIGQHIDSVAFPLMTVTLVFRERHYPQPISPCRVLNSTVMHCPTPEIKLPTGISKRDLSSVSQRGSKAGTGYGARVRREVGRYNSDELQFYIGLLLDGVPTYRNISETLPQFGQLDIFGNPEVHRFLGDMLDFRQNDEHIIIKGARLDHGCSAGDYNVTVGLEQCEVRELQTNQLTCRPPKTKPKLGQFHRNGAPRVKVVVGNIKIVVGYLRYEEKGSNVTRIAVIVAVCLLVVLMLAVLLGCCIYQKRKQTSKPNDTGPQIAYDEQPHDYIGMQRKPPRDIVKALSSSLAAKIECAKIDSKRMSLGKMIGKGNFGEVHIGQLADEHNKAKLKPVAIKTIRDADSVRSVSEFLEEATIMHNFHHPNVLCLLGVVIDNNKPYVIMPLMEHGDLRVFISNRERDFTLRELLGFGHQVAKGMAYLEDARFVHRDLAARNCMVDGGLTVKIADFGLARDIYDGDYYKVQDKYRPLPIKWMAIETLQDSKFTSKSDVWSYGVVLWELLTRGLKPYSDVDNIDLRRFLEMGRRLEKPEVTPQCIYDLMTQCWLEDPDVRPSFADICKIMANILAADIPTTSPDYVNYLVPVDLVGERPSHGGYLNVGPSKPSPDDYLNLAGGTNAGPSTLSPDGYLAMAGETNAGPSKPSPDGYLVMADGTNDQAKERSESV